MLVHQLCEHSAKHIEGVELGKVNTEGLRYDIYVIIVNISLMHCKKFVIVNISLKNAKH